HVESGANVHDLRGASDDVEWSTRLMSDLEKHLAARNLNLPLRAAVAHGYLRVGVEAQHRVVSEAPSELFAVPRGIADRWGIVATPEQDGDGGGDQHDHACGGQAPAKGGSPLHEPRGIRWDGSDLGVICCPPGFSDQFLNRHALQFSRLRQILDDK